MSGSINIPVKGVWYKDLMKGSVKFGNGIRLEREPKNPHHKKAIAVYQDKLHLGYIPKKIADGISKKELKELQKMKITVAAITYDRDTVRDIGIKIEEE